MSFRNWWRHYHHDCDTPVTVRITIDIPLGVHHMPDAALDAAIADLAKAVSDAAVRVAAAITPVNLTAEIQQVKDITAQVEQIAPTPTPAPAP